MKKLITSILILLIISLCGCSYITDSLFEDNSVQTLKNWSFQYNSATKDYSVFFALLNKQGKAVASDATVDIKIADTSGNELYKARKIRR